MVRLCCSLMWLLFNSCKSLGKGSRWKGKLAAIECLLLEGEMIVHFGSGNMKLYLHLQGQPCWLPFLFPIFLFIMCRDQTVTTDDIIMARCINWSSKKIQCCPYFISLIVKHRLATQERPVVGHVFCSSVCVVLAALVQTAVQCLHLWVWILQV